MNVDKSKYVVLDVETNGLSPYLHDLLSISMYMPDKGKKYERYLPPEKNGKVFEEATKINGITNDMVINKSPITQDEWNSLMEEFDLYNREILHYGKIDQSFIKEYLYRHRIRGFEKLTFHNIKRHFLTNSFSNGEYSKDNLCKGLGIEGVSEVHNGLHDCYLEWELFERIKGDYVWCIRLGDYQIGIYELNEDYYIPASRIRYFPNMKYAVGLPDIKVDYEKVFSIKLSSKCENRLDKWSQPAGFASEKILKAELDAIDVSDDSFAKENFKKMKLIGKFSYQPEEHIIPVVENPDGTLIAVNKEDEALIRESNRTMKAIRKEIKPLIKYIKKNIFESSSIKTQEIVINDELKAFGYTDFSNDSACLEMKFSSGLIDDFYHNKYHPLINKHKYQLYILSKNRPMYLLIGGYSEFIILKAKFYVGKDLIREAITANREYKSTPVLQFDMSGVFIKEFSSAKAASSELGFSVNAIRDNCNGRHHSTRGYQFKYKNSDKKIENATVGDSPIQRKT